ncbi:MAG: CDP-alcohol phosphatidyltransferase family protein [Deltaproteobacteria bacterium]|nr:CDP-alcohol phosphatidyltransferase family protein [Deltaproteobacteria bacterium]
MFAAIADVYHRTKKPQDLAFNRYVARPAAAVLVAALAKTRVTPNQVTFASLALFTLAALGLALGPGWLWLLASTAVLEFSYVVDMADGQLARWRGTSSPAGAHLDYMADEFKALLLIAALGVRLWLATQQSLWLVEALLGVVTVACAITLTSFLRRPEVVAATGKRASAAAGDYGDGFAVDAPVATQRSLLGKLIGAAESIGKFIVHYPTYLWLVALLDRIDVFVHIYLFMNLAYAARSMLVVVWRLGRRT